MEITRVAESAAAVVSAAGLALTAAIWLTTRAWSPAVPVLLDFLLAAGLLRLSAADDWRAISVAAGIVGVRMLVTSTATASPPLARVLARPHGRSQRRRASGSGARERAPGRAGRRH